MPQLRAYHRPTSVEEVLQLLARDGVNTAVLAGGTQLNPHMDVLIDEVVDLQAAGLDQVGHGEERLLLGAMVRLQTVVDDTRIPVLLREMAYREGPNTFRNAGTVGGAIITADAESEFLAALLVYDAMVTVATAAGTHTVSLADFLQNSTAGLRDGVLIAMTLETDGETAHARVARTPADTPIVAAVGRKDTSGHSRLALCGVAVTPILVDPSNLDALSPAGDFRGTAAYRQEMARVLTGRVLTELE